MSRSVTPSKSHKGQGSFFGLHRTLPCHSFRNFHANSMSLLWHSLSSYHATYMPLLCHSFRTFFAFYTMPFIKAFPLRFLVVSVTFLCHFSRPYHATSTPLLRHFHVHSEPFSGLFHSNSPTLLVTLTSRFHATSLKLSCHPMTHLRATSKLEPVSSLPRHIYVTLSLHTRHYNV